MCFVESEVISKVISWRDFGNRQAGLVLGGDAAPFYPYVFFLEESKC